MTSADATASYLGASEGELRTGRPSRRLLAMVDQRQLFAHRGTLELRGASIDLAGWRTIAPAQVAGVELAFTPAYPRWLAAGARGGRAPSFGVFGSLGKPLVVRLVGEDPLYLLIDFHWFTGTNKARAWAPRIAKWAAGGQVR